MPDLLNNNSQLKISKSWFYVIFALISLIFLTALLAYADVGFFSRYWYDDFCTASYLRERGFIGSQIFWYTNWSGRFSFHLAVNSAELFGQGLVPFLPLLALLSWLAATTWTIYQVLLSIRLPFRLSGAFLLAQLVVFSTLSSSPDIAQSLYWQTGMLTYLAPLIFLTIWVGLFIYVLRERPPKKKFWAMTALSFLLSLLTCGFSETSGVLQLGTLALLLAACVIYFSPAIRKTALPLILAGLLGTILAFAVIMGSPGNKTRQDTLPPPPPPVTVIKSSVSYTLSFIERHTRRSRGVTLLTLLFPAWLIVLLRLLKPDYSQSSTVSQIRLGKAFKIIALCTLIGALLTVSCFIPAYHFLSDTLPLRAQIIPKFVIVIFMMGCSLLAGQAFLNSFSDGRKIKTLFLTISSVLIAVLLIVSPASSARTAFSLADKAAALAAEWDNAEQLIYEAKRHNSSNVTIPKINADDWDLGFGRPDMQLSEKASDAQNGCAARYYEIESIKTE